MTTSLVLSSGYSIPALGLGTYLSKPGEVAAAVREALKLGYRHIDCAYFYQNEDEIGQAIQDSIKAGIVKREDLFVTTKLFMGFMRSDLVRKGFDESLAKLKLSYIDLFLIHFPLSIKEGAGMHPVDEHGNLQYSTAHFRDTWLEMEKLVDAKLARSIGVSNFNHKQIQEILSKCRIKPAMNQIESHPFFNNNKLIEFCHSHNIHVTAYSPLGSPANPLLPAGSPTVLEDPVVKEIAAKYKKSPTQVCIRYGIDRGIIVIPKSVTASRIKENGDVFDFKLSSDDVKKLNTLTKKDGRVVDPPPYRGHPEYPFKEEY